ncbi:MAG: hypothetical protein V8R67_09400 [Eubacterium sp.]
MAEYLSGDLFRVVHLVSLDYIDKYEEEPVVQEVLEEADLVLPGKKRFLVYIMWMFWRQAAWW